MCLPGRDHSEVDEEAGWLRVAAAARIPLGERATELCTFVLGAGVDSLFRARPARSPRGRPQSCPLGPLLQLLCPPTWLYSCTRVWSSGAEAPFCLSVLDSTRQSSPAKTCRPFRGFTLSGLLSFLLLLLLLPGRLPGQTWRSDQRPKKLLGAPLVAMLRCGRRVAVEGLAPTFLHVAPRLSCLLARPSSIPSFPHSGLSREPSKCTSFPAFSSFIHQSLLLSPTVSI